jgi:hypothetical protein
MKCSCCIILNRESFYTVNPFVLQWAIFARGLLLQTLTRLGREIREDVLVRVEDERSTR